MIIEQILRKCKIYIMKNLIFEQTFELKLTKLMN